MTPPRPGRRRRVRQARTAAGRAAGVRSAAGALGAATSCWPGGAVEVLVVAIAQRRADPGRAQAQLAAYLERVRVTRPRDHRRRPASGAGVPESPALGRALRQTLALKLDGFVSGRDEELDTALRLVRGDVMSTRRWNELQWDGAAGPLRGLLPDAHRPGHRGRLLDPLDDGRAAGRRPARRRRARCGSWRWTRATRPRTSA